MIVTYLFNTKTFYEINLNKTQKLGKSMLINVTKGWFVDQKLKLSYFLSCI